MLVFMIWERVAIYVCGRMEVNEINLVWKGKYSAYEGRKTAEEEQNR